MLRLPPLHLLARALSQTLTVRPGVAPGVSQGCGNLSHCSSVEVCMWLMQNYYATLYQPTISEHQIQASVLEIKLA